MRRVLPLALAFALACSRETPAPPPTPSQPAATETQTSSAIPTSTTTPIVDKGTYDAAMVWLAANPGFRFALKDRGVNAEGEMKRARVGMEEVTFRADGIEWRGVASARGVVWSKRDGAAWSEAAPPDYAGRLYQRVTFAFDPQKKEGAAPLVSSDATSNVYRFTDANTGEVHELRVSKRDAHIEWMKIDNDVELTVR